MLLSVQPGIKQVFQGQQTLFYGYKRKECGDGKVIPKYVHNTTRDHFGTTLKVRN